MEHKQIPIWFFIGGLLAIYGLLILGSGIYGVLHPPPPAQRVALWELHADIWWGALMLGLGILYCVRFRPRPAAAPVLEALEQAPRATPVK